MGRPSDGFAERLERLESGDHRARFDSKVRLLITESVEALPVRETENEEKISRLLGLMEDLAKRMDGLDRKNRSLAEELRHRARRERKRRRAIALVTAVSVILGVGAWAKVRIHTPKAAAAPLD